MDPGAPGQARLPEGRGRANTEWGPRQHPPTHEVHVGPLAYDPKVKTFSTVILFNSPPAWHGAVSLSGSFSAELFY